MWFVVAFRTPSLVRMLLSAAVWQIEDNMSLVTWYPRLSAEAEAASVLTVKMWAMRRIVVEVW